MVIQEQKCLESNREYHKNAKTIKCLKCQKLNYQSLADAEVLEYCQLSIFNGVTNPHTILFKRYNRIAMGVEVNQNYNYPKFKQTNCSLAVAKPLFIKNIGGGYLLP